MQITTRLTVFERDTYSSFSHCLTSEWQPMKAADDKDVDAQWMHQAVAAAHDARERGEVPIGTCIVADDQILAVAGNRTITDQDPTAHAEIVALREAARKVGNHRITNAVVYSTLEPCVMCAGALIQARVKRLVYGARDERAGAVESRFRVCDTDFLNHRIDVSAGVLEPECREIMQEFFRDRRKRKMLNAGC